MTKDLLVLHYYLYMNSINIDMWSHGPFSSVDKTNYAGVRDQNVASGNRELRMEKTEGNRKRYINKNKTKHSSS